jgi:hypothetical protein
MMKIRRIKLAGYAEVHTSKFLVIKPEGKRLLGSLKRRWEFNI